MLYTVQDTTMQALGDAVRKALGVNNTIEEIKGIVFDKDNWKITITPKYSTNNRYILNGSVNLDHIGNSFYIQGDNKDYLYGDQSHSLKNTEFPIEIETNAEQITIRFFTSYTGITCSFDLTIIPLDENGNEFKYTPAEMVEKIDGLMTIPDEALILTGSCIYRFAYNSNNWLIETAGDKITTKDISSANYMFNESSKLEYIPFDINFNNSQTHTIGNMFYRCNKLKNIPMLNGVKVAGSSSAIFSECYNIRYFPEHFAEDWDFTELNNYVYGGMCYCFQGCYSLRKIPTVLLNNFHNKATSYYSSSYYQAFYVCVSLDDINGIGISGANLTSNVFQNTFNLCCRASNITFLVNNDGTPKTANWKGQTIDLSVGGWTNTTYIPYILNYNSGITADKEVKDDATYQALKDDPDWFSTDINYSRYNHDSAVNTINSLPDTSAYLATNGGTNIIKFMGQSGALTDGGAINTLTEEEIAVASAKGWTVSLV